MSAPDLPTCREVIDFLGAYLDDELPADERERFEAHLAVCPACVAYLDSYRETVRLERAALPATGEVPEDLIRAVLASRPR